MFKKGGKGLIFDDPFLSFIQALRIRLDIKDINFLDNIH
jgi:hypothetical protein